MHLCIDMQLYVRGTNALARPMDGAGYAGGSEDRSCVAREDHLHPFRPADAAGRRPGHMATLLPAMGGVYRESGLIRGMLRYCLNS